MLLFAFVFEAALKDYCKYLQLLQFHLKAFHFLQYLWPEGFLPQQNVFHLPLYKQNLPNLFSPELIPSYAITPNGNACLQTREK